MLTESRSSSYLPWVDLARIIAILFVVIVHVFVLNFVRVNILAPTHSPTLVAVPLVTILVFAISWVIIFILQKIPIVRALVA